MTALDPHALDRLRRTMGNEGEFRSMLEEFLSSSARLMQDLERACEASRAVDVERTAHTLKSMARMVGAFELAETCADTEAGAAGGMFPDASRFGRQLQAAREAVRACLL